MDKIRLDRILSDLKHGDLIDTSLTELECIEIIERNKELEGALRGVYGIIDDSTGVEGYHLNGAIAEWDECPEVQEAYDVLPPAEDKEEVCTCEYWEGANIKGKCTECGKKIKEV